MFIANIKYLTFDDRKLMLIGIPVLSLLIPVIFFQVGIIELFKYGITEYIEHVIYTIVFWIFCRWLTIQLRKKYDRFDQIRKRLMVQALIKIPSIFLISLLIKPPIELYYQLTERPNVCNPDLVQALSAIYFLTLFVFLLYETIYYIAQYKQALEEKNQLQLAHVQGQLDNLRNQINPHFLFNSLNTLMNLIPMDSDRAMNYLDKLSRFYRYVVSNRSQTLTSLQEELNVTRIYADLLKERFQDAIHIQLPEKVPYDTQILPLSLQLLIENAVKHNIVSHKRPLRIEVAIDEAGEYLWVHNNIQKKIQEVSSTGMGLSNIKERFAFFTEAEVETIDDGQQFSVGLPFVHQKVEV
ncbi:MAG: histidine kinase [Bacteroidota bacterium]